MLDILMITYRSERYEKHALESLRTKTDVPHRLSVVDNNAENRGITTLWNEFARKSTAEFLCYANPDIICAAGWASRLLRAFDHADVVIANPSTPKFYPNSDPCSRLQALHAPEVVSEAGQLLIDRLDELGEKLPPVIVDDPLSYGFCYCIRRDWLAAQGYFDEAFGFYGQEADMNFRALLAGKRVVCVKNSVVLHYGQGSSGGGKTPLLLDATRRSLARMREKHPAWPVMFGWYA